MTVEQRVRLFLTRYRELVKEFGLAITYNNDDRAELPLALRWNMDVRATHADEETPSFIMFVGDDPNFPDEMHAFLYDENDRMYCVEPYSDMPTYDEGYVKKTDEQVRAEMRARGINV